MSEQTQTGELVSMKNLLEAGVTFWPPEKSLEPEDEVLYIWH